MSAGKEHQLVFPPVDYTSRWIQDFAVALAQGKPHAITGQDGWINNAVVEAAYASRDRGQSVEVATFPWGADEP